MIMRATEVSNRLDNLYSEVESVKGMIEEDVQRAYNVDSKDEILAILYEEITALENYQGEDCSEDDGMDYMGLQQSLGLPVTRW